MYLQQLKPLSGCLEKLNRFGMNRCSQHTELLVHKAFAHKLWGMYKWNYLNGDPSINVFFTCGLLNSSHWKLGGPLTQLPVLILTWGGIVGDTDRHWLLVSFVKAELRFHFLVMANINPTEEINKKIKIITESFKKRSLSFLMFSSNTVNLSVRTIKKKKKNAFLQCVFCFRQPQLCWSRTISILKNLWKMEFSLNTKRVGDTK